MILILSPRVNVIILSAYVARNHRMSQSCAIGDVEDGVGPTAEHPDGRCLTNA
jgi:hypothetical protein